MNKSAEKSIHTLKPGDKITRFFVIRKIELKTKKNGEPYVVMEFGDPSGRITATFWDNPLDYFNQYKTADVVKIMGTITQYKDTLQLSVDKIRKTGPGDNINRYDFLPKINLDLDQCKKDFLNILSSIENVHLKALIDKTLNHPLYKESFFIAPGGKLWHHAYMGGLLEHTFSVMTVCNSMCKQYPKADRDLLLTGAALHDIGKVEEYTYSMGYIDYSDEGRLWGHISIGAQRIRSFIEEMELENGFPEELKKNIIHLILSHQGELEHGSPVLPATLEAMILYYADEMDSKANALQHIIEQDKAPGKNWSRYIHLLNRFIYLGGENKVADHKSTDYSSESDPDSPLPLFDQSPDS